MEAPRMCRSSLVPLVVLALCIANSQAQQAPKLNLQIKDEKPLAGSRSALAFMGPTQCDSQGNIYFRPAAGFSLDWTAPVIKISPEGEQKAIFSLQGQPGFEQARVEISEYAVGLRGAVYLLVRKCEGKKTRKCEIDVVTFGEDGSFQSTTKLERYFEPSQLAVFPGGEFLVTGLVSEDMPMRDVPSGAADRKVPPDRPYTAIFDSSGRVHFEVPLPTQMEDKIAPSEKEGDELRLAVELGMVAVGQDGNIYLTRRTAVPLVYVISPTGKVLRHFRVSPPEENFWPLEMRYAIGGRLVLEFAEKVGDGSYNTASAIFSLVEAETGEAVINYQVAPGLGGIFACYTPNGFTFLGGSKEGHSVIRRLIPH